MTAATAIAIGSARPRRGPGARTFNNLHARTTIEGAVRFVNWANARTNVTATDVRSYLQCSRATAYNWLRALKDARGEA